MKNIFQYLLILLTASLSVNAYTLRGSISSLPNVVIEPLTASDISSTKIILRNRETSRISETYFKNIKGEFAFNNIAEGSYLLYLESLPFITPNKYRVDIRPGEVEVHQLIAGHDTTNDLGPRVSYPIVIENISRAKYTVEREAFSLINMIKSPMMLMSLGSLVMVFLLPKMAANIDPETLDQLQQHQKRQNQAMDKVNSFDVASFIAEKSK